MTPRGLIAVVVRVAGILCVFWALQASGNLFFLSRVSQLQSRQPSDVNYSFLLYVCAMWAIAIGLIAFSNSIAALLALGVGGSTEQPLPSVGLSLGEFAKLAYRLAGVVLCVLALSEAATVIAWWFGHTPEPGEKIPYQLRYQLIGPGSQFVLGIALAVVGSRSARRA